MDDTGWKVYSLQDYTPPLLVRVLLRFRSVQNHFDPISNKGVAFKTLFKTVYVVMVYSVVYDDINSDYDVNPEYDGTQIDNNDEPWRN